MEEEFFICTIPNCDIAVSKERNYHDQRGGFIAIGKKLFIEISKKSFIAIGNKVFITIGNKVFIAINRQSGKGIGYGNQRGTLRYVILQWQNKKGDMQICIAKRKMG